jgi:diguanylate cyclase (GGDEF)-like protein
MNLADFQGDPGVEAEGIPTDRSMDVHALRQLVIKDDLTELYNRRYFQERLREEKRRGDLQGLPFSLLILDIDHFKEVNDNFGHVTGDKVLVQVARILGESVREIDITCRYAGDEFVVILPGAGEEETEGVIRRLVQNLNAFPWSERTGIDLPKLTCSVGCAIYPDDSRELAQLIRRADQALYWAKKKGRDGWVRWSPRHVEAMAGAPAPATGGTLEMVGRNREREQIVRIIEEVRGGAGAAVLGEGEIGVGKSRLVRHASLRLEHAGFAILQIVGFRETAQIPYLPLREVMDYLGEAYPDALGEVLASLEAPHRLELERFFPSIARNGSGGNGQGNGSGGGSAEASTGGDRYQLAEAFLRLFVRLSRIRPLAIVVDNLQWVDDATRRLLGYLSRGISRERVLLIGLRRTGSGPETDFSESGEEAAGEDPVRRIVLDNLSREESDRLVEGLTGRDDLSEEFLGSLYRQTAGNPLFLEEIVKYLRREGGPGAARAPGGEQVTVPGTVTEMLRRQADAIPEDRRAILAMASVIGVEFGFDLLMLLSLKNEGYLLDVIDEAVRQGILKETTHPREVRYAFVNPLFQQVLYESINRRRRRNLHRQVGMFLEKYFLDRLEELYGDLAWHYQKGGDLWKALEYTIRAGEQAEALYANEEAIGYYDRAIEIIAGSRDGGRQERLHLELLERKGRICEIIGEFDRALEAFSEVERGLAGDPSARVDRARILERIGVVLDKAGDRQAAVLRLEEGLEVAGSADGETRARLLNALARIRLREGEFDRSIRGGEEALRCLPRDSQTTVAAQVHMTLGCNHLEKGAGKKAEYYMKRGIEISESAGDRNGLARIYLSMGTLYYNRGSYERADAYFRKSLDIAGEIGNLTLVIAGQNNIGMIARVRGSLKTAVRCWEEALEQAEKIDHHRYIAFLKCNLGNVYRELGEFSMALGRLTECLSMFEALKSRIDIARAHRGLAILYLQLGDPERAASIIRTDRSDGGEPDSVEKLRDLYMHGWVLRDQGRHDEALPLLRRALEGYREVGDPEDLTEALLNLAELHVRTGDYDAAAACLDEAEALAGQVRSRKFSALCLLHRASLRIARDDDPEAALPDLRRALRSFRLLDLPYFRMTAYHALGRVFRDLGREREARRAFRSGAEIVHYLKQRIFEKALLERFEALPVVVETLGGASSKGS